MRASLLNINGDILRRILILLPPGSLASLSCASKHISDNIKGDDDLWRSICYRKWAFPHKSSSWQKTYAISNGWHDPQFIATKITPDTDFISALLPLNEAGVVLAATSSNVCVIKAALRPMQDDGNSGCTFASKSQHHLLADCSLAQEITIHAMDMTMGDSGSCAVVGGCSSGALMMWRLNHSTWDLTHVHTSHHSGGGRGSPVVDVQILPGNHHVLGLHDATFNGVGVGRRNIVRVYDMKADKDLGSIKDPFEQYEIVCMCTLSGGDGNGDELVLGSVHGSYCTRCYDAGLPSLCNHKHNCATASFSSVDMRTPCQIVQRFSMHNSSLYPLMASSRSHFIFTSHVDQPLAVWDRRNLSCPLFEQDRLRYFRSAYGPPHCEVGFHQASSRGLTGHTKKLSSSLSLPSLPTPTSSSDLTREMKASGCTSGHQQAVHVANKVSPTPGHVLVDPGEQYDDSFSDERSYEDMELVDSEYSSEHEEDERNGGLSAHELESHRQWLLGDQDISRRQAAYSDAPESMLVAVAEYARFPLGAACKRGSEHCSLWLVCNNDILLGRTENGLLWRWDLSRTLGWACPPAGNKSKLQGPYLNPQLGLEHDSLDSYCRKSGSWHMVDALSHTSAWGGLAKYDDWPLPLGCVPCERNLPVTHMSPWSWDPTGLVMLAHEEDEERDSIVMAQLSMA
ncbi:hypothetical protein CEUSTIGMA_g9585.t1 [Chlamydomonas eustigma]|uniref:F-box domain-containing protein n=1 Tax=Chlamydomonas eustigma TaxID=1157962 RepID=A0A250XGG0_9CHLO|nr:hypothetical protein CEUSTIGMA_g9585.t1 [Chlamydomonas eustigma]|eukprot:GAX82157.1 hypothetical protein CEUSTIGMA_g9585.t1 [Chlamydomonas eustigma]